MGSGRIQLLRVALRVSLALVLLGTAFAQPLSAHGLAPVAAGSVLPAPASESTPPVTPASDGPGLVIVQTLPRTAPAVSPATVRDPSGVLPGLPWEDSGGLTISAEGTPWRVLLLDGQPAPDGMLVGGDDAPAPCAPEQPCPVTFWCPGLDGTPALNEGTNTMTIRSTCPYRIADDADLLGSPQIAVNADDPNSMAFFSLHGGGSTEGPTPRSRDPSPEGLTSVTGLSHTTFTSQDHGRSWHDNPWGTDGFGEHAAGTMDNDGNLYISALWSKRLGEGRFNYVIKLYKEQDGRYTIATYQPSKTFSNRADGNTITDANIVFLSAPRVEPLNATGNETQNATAPAGQSDVGNYTNGESYGTNNSAEDRVMAVWFEKALDWRNSTTGKSSWIDAAWTDTTPKDNWTRLADDELIGPCMAASNPVAFNGKAYVACVADAGYQGRSRAHIGDIDVWSIDPKTGKTTLEENTRLVGGQPRMASREDGFMAVATVAVLDERNVDAQVTFGWYGAHWSDKQNVGSQLHNLMGNHRVREARVTSMALTQERNSMFLTYMERVNTEGEVPEPNPSTLNTDPNQVIEYRKLVSTFTPCYSGAWDAYDLQTGVARHPFNEEIIGDAANATGVFDDLQDGMQFWRDPDSGEERVYFAYADHGVIQFGALVGGGTSPPCALTPPFLGLPQPPVPAALSTASPYTTMVGATVGATALAMVTYLLSAKKRTLTFSAAKDKRK